VKTPALMRGYLDRDDLTAKVVSQGWFLTGDIGVIDDRGWLYLRGREREEINKGGMKVYPADVDSVIERFPATTDVCTFAYPEALLGEDVGAAVVLSDAADATLLDLFDWTNRHLARHQVPQRWYVLAEIPRTSRGKVNRSVVAEQCAGLTPVDVAALRRTANRAGS
jgi:acyl-CoA synthetase (AMP-forming)/AMP-acid ligase II